MKIRLVEAWMTEYGREGRNDVRADVREYLEALLHDCSGSDLTNWQVRLHD